MKKFNYIIEAFVEKYNGIIQILLLALVIFINAVIVCFGEFGRGQIDVLSLFKMVISLIIGITVELIILQIKDSSTQRKVNGIGEVVRQIAKQEDIWREETDLEPFFDSTQQEFFVSGIIVDKLVTKYKQKIKELLDRDIKVRILIESFEELEEAAKFLYGQDYNRNTSLRLIKSRLDNTLVYLQSMGRIEEYFSKGLLEVGVSNAPVVNPSIIAYDYTKNSTFETRRTELATAPKMSVRFYMQGVDGPSSELKTHPTLLINSNTMAKQYDDFVKAINNIWMSSYQIKTKDDFDRLRQDIKQQLEGM